MKKHSLEAGLIEMLPHAVVFLSEGRVHLANHAFAKLLGQPMHEIMNRSMDELCSSASTGFGAAVLGADLSATTSSLGKLPEYEIIRADGQRRWVSLAARFVEHDGESGLMLVLTDLTRLRHLEEEARRSHKAVETMHLGVTITDPAGRIIYVNPAQARSFGADPAELLGREGRILAPPELWRDWPEEEPASWQHFSRESVNLRRDGTSFPVQLISDSIRDADGRLIGRVTICENLTDRKAAEDELRRAHLELEERVRQRTAELESANELLRREISERERIERHLEESERRYRTLAEDLDEVVFSADPAGQISYISPVIERLTGHQSEDLVGQNMAVLVDENDQAALRSSLAQTCSGSRQTATLGLRAQDGQRLSVRMSTVRTTDKDAVVGVRGVLSDITERRRLEDQLLQAQKLEAVGRLAGGVAHDINNLLQAILATVQSLQRNKPGIYSELTEIVSHVRRGAGITRQLLLFARRTATRPECLDLNEALDHFSVLLRRLIRENITFSLDLAPEAVPVEIDRGQLEQVLMNLVINAIDAMPAGGTLRLRTGRSEEGWSWLEVADTGCGMTAEVKAHIYEPFFTTKPADQGTGLGLAVVLGIVTAHGGHLDMTSAVGAGTTFRISLPGNATIGGRTGGGAAEQPPEPRPEEVTVLVVEDDPLVRQAMDQALVSLRYRPTLVTCAAEALAITESRRFSILITDLMLPDLRGDELASRLCERDPAMGIVLMSGYAEEDQTGVGTTPAAFAFLQKPFDLETLGQALARVLAPGPATP